MIKKEKFKISEFIDFLEGIKSKHIKFRAWDKITKQIFEVKQIDFNAIERNVYGIITYKSFLGGVNESLSFRSFDNVELMQYTGLKDKKGFEIYEGDILKDNRGYIGNVGYNSLYARFEIKVIKTPAGAEWQIGDDFSLDELNIANSEYKIIGNIYENSELLK